MQIQIRTYLFGNLLTRIKVKTKKVYFLPIFWLLDPGPDSDRESHVSADPGGYVLGSA